MVKRKNESSSTKKPIKKATKKIDPLELLMQKHNSLEKFETPYGVRIRCTITSHEMMPTFDQVEKYLNSKRYIKASEKWFDDEWIGEFLPHIVPHKRDSKKMYCLLSKQTLNKIRSEVEKHVNGRRFLRLKQEFDDAAAKRAEREEKRRAKRLKKAGKNDNEEEEEDDDDSESNDSGSGEEEQDDDEEESESDDDEDGDEMDSDDE